MRYRDAWQLLLVCGVSATVAACGGQGVKTAATPTPAKESSAPAAQPAAAPTVEMPRGKEFVNDDPAFSFIYPRYVRSQSPEVPTEVLRVADRTGLPSFVCGVYDATEKTTLEGWPQGGFEAFKEDPRYADKTDWRLESQTMTKLVDGSPAVEYEVGWDWQPGYRLYTTFLVARKGDKIISCNVTTTEAGNKTNKKYLYSLRVR